MKKKVLAIICAALIAATGVTVLAGCESAKPSAQKVTAEDLYAMSAVSGASYLLESESGSASAGVLLSRAQASATATARPDGISESDANGIRDALVMFDEILDGGVRETVAENTDDGEFADYAYVMTVGEMRMYYNETDSKTETDGDETEVKTRLEGVMAAGEARFDVSGEKKIETENGENEEEIEFTTRSRSNPDNYVKVSQTVENGEYEFEYTIYKDGKKIQELEVEIEWEDDGVELEFSVADKTGASTQNTKYKVEKKVDSDEYEIKFSAHADNGKIIAVATETGYKFTYSNGFVEEL